jgi:O-antigen ligase
MRLIHTIAKWILRCEFYLLTAILVIFWFPDQNRVIGLLGFVPLFAARFILYRRLWKPTPLDPLLVAFLALCAINVFVAPYALIARGTGGLVMLGRPLMGMLLALSLADRAYRLRSMDSLILPSIVLAFVVAGLALVSSQWTEKSAAFLFIIDLLPKVRGVPQIGFNVNEIAGAMAYLTPLLAGIAIFYWIVQPTNQHMRLYRILASAAFCLLWLAAFLGQSRFALFGILPALFAISLVLIPRGGWRTAALVCVTLFALLQLLLLAGVIGPQVEQLQERDQDSLMARLNMWNSGLQIIRDYPITGSGLNTYRLTAVRAHYPVEGFERIPHAHNEWVQIGTDLGIPGLLVFAGWFVVLGWMVLRIWRRGDIRARSIALAAACGLAAHLFYGLGDAVPVWDRFAFVFWWLVGLELAQYLIVTYHGEAEPHDVPVKTA